MNTPRIIGQILEISGSVDNRRPAHDRWKTIVTLAQASPGYLLRTLRDDVLVLCAVVLLGTVAAHAQDATWLAAPATGDWNTGTNWTGAAVPTGTATFDASSTTTVIFSSPSTSVGALLFNAAAPTYSFNLSGSSLTITGAGITNNSSNSPIFTVSSVALPLAVLSIHGTAANAAIINNNLGETDFVGLTTAGTANITTNSGGVTAFEQQSTGGTATITTNNGGLTVFENNPPDGGGQARLITTAGGIVDISLLTPSGMTTGSIEGAGIYRLGSKALTVGGNNLSTEVSGTIVDGGFSTATGGSLIKVGTGTLTLSGLNTYSGGTTIAAGTLSVASDTNLGISAGGVNLEGGELLTTGLNFASARVVTLNTAGTPNTLAASAGTTAVYSGFISGPGSLQVGDATNAGTVVLSSGANTYTGGTTVIGGAVLSVDTDAELGNASGGITLQGGKLVMTTDGFFTSRVLTLDPGTNTLAAPDANSFRNVTFSGLVNGPGGLTIGDQNSQILSVTLANPGNSYAGGTTITGGATLEVDTDTELGNLSGGITLNGGTLKTTANVFISARTITLLPNLIANTLAAGFSNTATYTGLITGSGGLTISGGTVVLTHANTYSGGTKVASATVSVSNDANFGDLSGGITLMGGEIVSTVDGFVSPRPILLIAGGDFQNVLAAGDGTTGTYSGVISGNSSLQIGSGNGPEATGTVALSGINTYLGGTLVTAGARLSFGADTALGDGSSNITLEGGELRTTATFSTARLISLENSGFTNILAAAGSTTMTYQGIISGNSGGLQIGDGQSTGTVVFKANNTYFGDTTVFANAVLSVDKDTELGDPSDGIKLKSGGELLTSVDFITARSVNLNPPIVGNGIGIATPLGPVSINVLAAAADTTATYTGLAFGTGGLAIGDLKGNSGTVVLTNIGNSYTGGTIIQGGATLSVASDLMLGNSGFGLTLRGGEFLTTGQAFSSARAITIAPGADIIATATGTTAAYTGVLSNGGTLIVGDSTHGGTIVLGGLNTYSGGTIINSGTLLVDSAQALGTGDVTVSGGVLAADPQIINVLGNYAQNAGGTLQLSVTGANPGQYDTLKVGGNAVLAGTLQLISLGFTPVAGNQLGLVSTGGSVSGRFTHFVDPFVVGPSFNTIDLVYSRNTVVLKFLNVTTPISPVVPVVPTTPTTPGTPPVVVSTIDFGSFALSPNQSAAAALVDHAQLDPRAAGVVGFLLKEPFASLPRDFEKISPDGLSSLYEIGFSDSNIQRLTLEGRLDDIRNGSSGFNSNMKVNGATVNDKSGADGKSSKGVVEPVLQPGPQNRWGVWVTGFGDFVNVDGDGNAQGYNFTTGGFSLGIDYRITDQLVVGVMGDYSHTWTSLNSSGNIDVNSGRGGIYATWYNHGIYLNGAIYAGHNNYSSSRSGLGGLADGNTGGTEWSTFISGGYDFHFGLLTVGPIAALQYSYVNIGGFSENGSLAPMQIQSDSVDSLRSDVGFRLFYQWKIGKVLVEPSLKAAWEHEYLYSALPITGGFVGVPGPSATFFGPSEGHDSAVVSVGVSVQLTPSILTYLNYDGQLGRGNYDSNAVTGGVSISF